MALDQSTGISDKHLLIFTRTGLNENFTVKEELVKMCSLNGGTKFSDIYAALGSVDDCGGFEKCSCIVHAGM